MKTLAEEINAMGSDYMDTRVSGSEIDAANATVFIMMGGAECV